MKIVGQGKEVNTEIPFKVWRKYAARCHISYESWEEGKVVLVKEFDKEVLSKLR